MIVCHCKAVCDRTIRDAVRGGARSRHQVTRRCGAGGVCGGCAPAIDDLVAEAHGETIEPDWDGLTLSPAR